MTAVRYPITAKKMLDIISDDDEIRIQIVTFRKDDPEGTIRTYGVFKR